MVFFRRHLSAVLRGTSLDELIRQTRVVVIDDKADEFPFDLMRSYGYAIDHWPDVVDLNKLDAGFYDIIVLDIGGVGRALDPQREGLAVLKHLKASNPLQIVVAYSGQSYEADKIAFFRDADQYLPKPSNVITWKETFEDILQTKLEPLARWRDLSQLMLRRGFTAKDVRKLEKEILAGIDGKSKDAQGTVLRALGAVEESIPLIAVCGRLLSLAIG